MITELFFKNYNFDLLFEYYSNGNLGPAAKKAISIINDVDDEKSNFDLSKNLERKMIEAGFSIEKTGTQRDVYFLDDYLVLKLASNEDGRKANKKEGSVAFQSLMSDFVPKVLASDPDGMWVIMERVVVATDSDDLRQWFEDIGIPSKFAYDKVIDMLYYSTEWYEEEILSGKMTVYEALINHLYNNEYDDEFDDEYTYSSSDENLDQDIKDSRIKKIEQEIRPLLEIPFIMKIMRIIQEEGIDYLRALQDFHPGNVGWAENFSRPVIIDWG